ncbi:PREDICTED: LOW QUALITY PROTEIN: ankyrin repeat domain-containing protein SOWAHA [Calidris pugnax]|uniref:LOW QUALITY PROTEIN: ankyrin repeat domain-containing protein SOWAHA n=1 Tax=Calidris pugnax TaxID=198806 RepID=UPI00071CDE6C|nr:PREDICTED: LOW QUALITY PROTEIN: ankyrin repeat domain-containing protein SOWAHA [Calidris pugnax]
MAELDISPAAVLAFLRERGGWVRNTELVSTFRPLLEAGGEAAERAERRERFKEAVNAVAVVKERDGAKVVVLRRHLRPAPPPGGAPPTGGAPGPPEEPASPLSPPEEEAAGSRSPGLRRGPKNHRASEEQWRRGRLAAVPLEEAEHQWLVMAAGGQWTQQLHGLLLGDASLAARRDFISGFTALHWAAKSGNCDMVTNIIRAAEKGGARVNVDARSHGGYTALHLAAMHGQEKIITMLVYSYHAKTDLRDYSGKKPHQYLKEGTSSAVRRLLGDPSLSHSTEPSVPIKKSTKLAASILSSTSTFLGVISDDMAFYDLTKGLRKPSSLNKLLAATTGPRRKPKTRGGFPSYSSLSEVTEEEEEEVVVKRRPVSELFFGH